MSCRPRFIVYYSHFKLLTILSFTCTYLYPGVLIPWDCIRYPSFFQKDSFLRWTLWLWTSWSSVHFPCLTRSIFLVVRVSGFRSSRLNKFLQVINGLHHVLYSLSFCRGFVFPWVHSTIPKQQSRFSLFGNFPQSHFPQVRFPLY